MSVGSEITCVIITLPVTVVWRPRPNLLIIERRTGESPVRRSIIWGLDLGSQTTVTAGGVTYLIMLSVSS